MEETISRELLQRAGYTEWKHNNFQKSFNDHKGRKYSIDCVYTDVLSGFWEFSIQFETGKGSVVIQTVQWFNENGKHSRNKISDAEDYLEKMWEANGSPYYELKGV